MEYIFVNNENDKKYIIEKILRSLPNWFGVEKSIKDYTEKGSMLPLICAYDNNMPIGFLVIKQHFKNSCEILVMAILEEYHRKGIGSQLVRLAENWCKEQKINFFMVKTLSDTNPDKHYACTRKFYKSVGFSKLEEIKEIWDEKNPCLLMIKYIG